MKKLLSIVAIVLGLMMSVHAERVCLTVSGD
jgi:hypothetical protein